MRRMLAVLALGAVVVACSEQATAPQPRTPAIAADFMNNPDGGSPWHARYQWDNYLSIWNNLPANTVRAYHTTFPLSQAIGGGTIFGGDDAVCGPTTSTSGLHLQEIAHWDPDPAHMDPTQLWIDNGGADVWIALVDRTRPGPCNTRPLIASGWGRLHYTDNNGSGMGRNQDAWTFRAEGRLTTPSGEKVQYNGLMHCVITKNQPFDQLRDCNFVINF
jgi:hypothetical protein